MCFKNEVINNMSDFAIEVKNVNKIYKLYDKATDRLKESLGLSSKKIVS